MWRERSNKEILRKEIFMLEQKQKGGESPLTSGPQFGFKNKNSWKEKSKGWINKHGSSVILPVIALLILAGGIYLYANQKNQDEIGSLSGEEFTADLQGKISGSAVEEITDIIPAGRKENNSIIEKAAKGNGVTHLARRALKDYTKDHPEELTNEHKIYIEDYLKDNIGSKPLNVGDEIAFSEDLIKEAIDASMQLTPEQLKNLEKYSALVVSW